MKPIVYLTGYAACDAAKLTGLPVYCRPRLWEGQEDPVHWRAAEDAMNRRAWRTGDVVMDLTRMDWWDKLKVALAMIGAHAYMDSAEHMLAA